MLVACELHGDDLTTQIEGGQVLRQVVVLLVLVLHLFVFVFVFVFVFLVLLSVAGSNGEKHK